MTPRHGWLLAFAVVAATLPQAAAATLDVKPFAVAILDSDFTPVDPQFILSHDMLGRSVLAPKPDGYVVQVDVGLRITDLAPPEHVGFGNVWFDVTVHDGLVENDLLPGWFPDERLWDTNGDFPGGIVNKWADNGDFGPDGTDLLGILVGTSPRNFFATTGGNEDPRRTLGIPPYHNSSGHENLDADYTGSVYLSMPGESGAEGALDLIVRQFSTYDENLNLNVDIDGTAHGGRLEFVVVPEPSAVGLLLAAMMTGAGAISTRRHVWRM